MNTKELATEIYNYVISRNRNGEHSDRWDDEREIEYIKTLIDNHHKKNDSSPILKEKK